MGLSITIRRLIVLATLLPLLTLTACKKERQEKSFNFNAHMEQIDNPSKVHLVYEQWIYWDPYDMINVASDCSTEGASEGYLSGSSSDYADYNAVFTVRLDEESKYFLGLHPASGSNVITPNGKGNSAFSATINLRSTQPYLHDSSFALQVMPMVAWYGGHWDGTEGSTPYNLDFHSLAGIVRLQFFNATNETKDIDHIEITSFDTLGIGQKKISGPFTVNNYTTFNPYLTATGSATHTLVLSAKDEDDNYVAFGSGALKSFYLVLPSQTAGGMDATTPYALKVKLYTKDNKTFECKLIVNTRRNGITYTRAIGVTEFKANNSSITAGLSGNGTVTRPFKVYDINDLKYLRDCYNSVERTINGQPITANTYIRLMRSDIVLTKTNWTSGIRNFVGHMTSVSNQSHPGIIDSCRNTPLFESVAEGGDVDGITLKSAVTFNTTSATGLSPFCTENAGRLRNCVVTTIPGHESQFNLSIFSSFAGLCVVNTGTIEGCRFEGKAEVQTGKNFAGICLINRGEINGCQVSSMTVRFATTNSTASGICYENEAGGTVSDSYFAADVTGSLIDWSGIVYKNSGTVEHCYLSSTGHIYTSGRVGGIVRLNQGASSKVNYCWLAGQLRGKSVGGIVDSLTAGQVINCSNQGASAMITVTDASGVCGGLVNTMTGGSIDNSYIYDITLVRPAVSTPTGGIVGKATGGSIDNCYSWESYHLFYGTNSGATLTHCHLVEGSQTGVANVNPATTNAFVDLQTSLNTDIPSGGKGWEGARENTTPPHLAAYTLTPSAKHVTR